MDIELFYNKDFLVYKRTETKDKGKVVRGYSAGTQYVGAFFRPSTDRTVRWDKQDFVIQEVLYCATSVDISLGDKVTKDNKDFDVVYIQNTNDQNHHYQIGLVSR